MLKQKTLNKIPSQGNGWTEILEIYKASHHLAALKKAKLKQSATGVYIGSICLTRHHEARIFKAEFDFLLVWICHEEGIVSDTADDVAFVCKLLQTPSIYG